MNVKCNLKIRQFRDDADLTQEQLGDILGKSFSTIKSWEAGKSYPNAKSVLMMCEIFHTDPNTLLGWYDTHPHDQDPPLAVDEAEVINGYRACTPDWKRNVRMNVQAAVGASLNVSEDSPSVSARTA
mgnify:CR=1 FL=1